MLEKELRRLREHDMQILKQRQKRLEFKEKQQIINKEKSAEASITEMRQRDNLCTSARIGNLFKASEDKRRMRESLEEWA